MLTALKIRNFKQFGEVEIELGNPVVFVGPNNSGKTTALQALALWDLGLRRLMGGESGLGQPARVEERSETINRLHVLAAPVPDLTMLWRDARVDEDGDRTFEISAEGVDEGRPWTAALQFRFVNAESLEVRIARAEGRLPVANGSLGIQAVYLPPVSGVTADETLLAPGAIEVRLGQGRTAEVLRNLCYRLATEAEHKGRWPAVRDRIGMRFGVELETPAYDPARGEIVMAYRTRAGSRLDLACSGRGMLQWLLLLSYIALHPHSVLLLDEPDAHLEAVRQRELYSTLCDAVREVGSQLVIVSHSEVFLEETGDRDTVVAFVGAPHRIDDRAKSQVRKALKEIGFSEYLQAEQTGWVLYVEGSTDLAILRSCAARLRHPAQDALQRPFAHYVTNQASKAWHHFFGLREAKPDIAGYLLLDRQERVPERPPLRQHVWRRREIENYLCRRTVLEAWAKEFGSSQGGLTTDPMSLLRDLFGLFEDAAELTGKPSPWSPDVKVTDDFLDPLFGQFFRRLGLPNLMQKTDYHQLARFVTPEEIDAEVVEVLDGIADVAAQARPAGG